MVESGYFICPKCNKACNFFGEVEWQTKNNQWIFRHFTEESKWGFYKYQESGVPLYVRETYPGAESAWKTISEFLDKKLIKSGPTEEDYNQCNKNTFKCSECGYTTFSFIEFTKFKSDLNKKLKDKDIEIERLKEKINLLSKNKGNDKNENQETAKSEEPKEITLKFMSTDQKIKNYEIKCKMTDKFVDVEGKLYEKFPEYLEEETKFTIHEKTIKRHKTIEQNELKDNDIVTLNII